MSLELATASQPDLDFEEPLGSFHGVVAFSNIDDHFFSGEKNWDHGVYTGYKYQCVEYARRFLLNAKGCIFGQCFRAAEIFSMTTVTSVATGEEHPFIGYPNGKTKEKPQPGDIFVYPFDKIMPVGHVAVISAVGDDWVGIAEQNQENKFWNGLPYGRKQPLTRDAEGNYTIVETDPEIVPSSGWMRTDVAFRLDDKGHILAPLVVLPRFQDKPNEKVATRFQCEPVAPPVDVSDNEAKASAVTAFKAAARRLGRRDEWSSVIMPSEELGVGHIGATFRIFKIITSLLRTAAQDEAFLSRCNIPEDLRGLIRQQLAFTEHHVAGHALLSLITVSHDPATNHYVCIDPNLDDTDHVVDAHIMEMNGRPRGFNQGFYPGGIKSDIGRILKAKCDEDRKRTGDAAAASSLVVFLDFGGSENFQGAFATDAEAAKFDAQRASTMFVAATTPAGEGYKVAVVNIVDVAYETDGHIVVLVDGQSERAAVVFKTAPWSTLLKVRETNDLVRRFVDSAVRIDDRGLHGNNARSEPLVLQPLWTALTSHPTFINELAALAKAHDAQRWSELRADGDEPEQGPGCSHNYQFFFPASYDAFRVMAPNVNVDGPTGIAAALKHKSYQKALKEEDSLKESLPGTAIALAVRAIVAGSRWSAGCYVEGRGDAVVRADVPYNHPANVVHPASLFYAMGSFDDE